MMNDDDVTMGNSMLTTCDKVIFLYHGVSSTGNGFVKGDRFSGSVKGLDALLCDVPKGFAAFLD